MLLASMHVGQGFFQHLQHLPRISDGQVYAMRRAELYRRAPDGRWASAEVLEAGDIELECVHASLLLDEIYEDVKFMTNEPLYLMDKA